ncbi:hypothetical protein [Tardiphaga sp.]|jgi:hypothetical protein|uniref:hypothetical protein n=1 Tax=Tardiphaga sp. TaxID=1926292 RepID=UPI0037DA4290
MCLFSAPQIPKPAPAPRVPQPDSFQAQEASDEARRIAAASNGSSANIVSDLNSSDVQSNRPVLNPTKAVYLGQ